MNRIIFFMMSIVVSLSVSAQMKKTQNYQDYIYQYKDLAIYEMLRYKVPASITLAQGLLESSAGKSELCRKGNNHFGIKCHGWTGAKTYHDDDAAGECFRAYKDALESYEDHSKFLVNSQRYKRLFKLSRTDYKGWAQGLKDCGYATNPQYATKLIQIIELYDLNVYDRANSYDRFMVQHSATTQTERGGTGLHPIHVFNKNYYLIARKGDTFKSIGEETELSYRKIAKYNERKKKDPIEEGEIIYLKKKQKRAPKQYKNHPHVVQPGESMYSIAQRYGMRVKYLYKKNKLPLDYDLKVGDKLRVY
ncbi:MAG: glucosaminidase domain-containing protein [Prevotella sp.]|nr:glucosaminidase domain-containing protein [Prevotella sp.]